MSSGPPHDPFDFDLLPAEQLCTVGGEQYVLREASADAGRQYNNARTGATQFDGDPTTKSFRVTGIRGAADVEILLVSLCLYKGAKLVPRDTIAGWKYSTVKKMYDWVKAHSDLDEKKPEETAKNGQGSTEATSLPPTGLAEPSASTSAGPAR